MLTAPQYVPMQLAGPEWPAALNRRPVDRPIRKSVISQRSDPWPKRMIWSATALLAVAFPMWWVLVGYFRQAPTENLSFLSADGWCSPNSEGIGQHCFGDFQLPRLLLDAPSVWDDPGGKIAVGYTPTGLIPHVAAKGLEVAGLGIRGSLIAFLVAMGVAMLLPAVLTALKGSPGTRGPLPLLLFFAAAMPVLIAFDRGNSAGFAIPFLTLFAIFAGRDPSWVAPASVMAAAAVRPQFVLLAIGLLALRRVKAALAAVAGTIAILVAGFLAWPGSTSANLHAWWADITAYGGTVGPERQVTNLSASRAVYLTGDALTTIPGPLRSIGGALMDFAQANAGLIGPALAAACAVAFFLRRGSIPRSIAVVTALALPALVPGLSFSYYLGFAVAVAVAICGPADPMDLRRRNRAQSGLLCDLTNSRVAHRLWGWLVIATCSLSLAPLVFRSAQVGYTPTQAWLAPLWLAVCVAPLAWGATLWIVRQSRQ